MRHALANMHDNLMVEVVDRSKYQGEVVYPGDINLRVKISADVDQNHDFYINLGIFIDNLKQQKV